jgi:curved DNA-binding protein CbpA
LKGADLQSQAFETLGIEPTIDGRAIRTAFVRLARIYHPDRLVGQPEDVRVEAERRMKEASAAYELLRTSNKALHQGKSVFKDRDIQEAARKYRETMEERRREDAKQRIKWRRWEAIELEARERAEAESALAAAAMRETGEVHEAPAVSAPASRRASSYATVRAEGPRQLPSKTPSSGLQQRIEAARRREREAAERRKAETNGSADAAR